MLIILCNCPRCPHVQRVLYKASKLFLMRNDVKYYHNKKKKGSNMNNAFSWSFIDSSTAVKHAACVWWRLYPPQSHTGSWFLSTKKRSYVHKRELATCIKLYLIAEMPQSQPQCTITQLFEQVYDAGRKRVV